MRKPIVVVGFGARHARDSHRARKQMANTIAPERLVCSELDTSGIGPTLTQKSAQTLAAARYLFRCWSRKVKICHERPLSKQLA
jgi:hypothetical protein